jgi:catechol 2,3-dioxygenase-like lactoylglutathione lyase family enzyme
MNYEIQVITLPVSDVDRARTFYTERAGFRLDVDYAPNAGYRVVQLSPPGSPCAIQFGVGLTDAPPGSARTTYLVVNDLSAAHQQLHDRGVPVSDITHKPSIDDWQGDWAKGIDPQRRDYASVAHFADPDANTWIVQEIGYQRG